MEKFDGVYRGVLTINKEDVNLFNLEIDPFVECEKSNGNFLLDVYGTESLWDKVLEDELNDKSTHDTTLEVINNKDLFLDGIITKFDENDNIIDEVEFEYTINGVGKESLLKNALELIRNS